MKITGFQVMSFNYPKEIQDMINKNASIGMVGDVGKYQQISVADAMAKGGSSGSNSAADMAGMMVGMNIAKDMVETMKDSNSGNQQTAGSQGPNFCPNCGQKNEGAKFCPNCGQKLA